jgi:hypothetical protein
METVEAELTLLWAARLSVSYAHLEEFHGEQEAQSA